MLAPTAEREGTRRVVSAAASDGPRIAVRVPAKINLFLAMRGLRDDGYHELTTVFQTVSIHDELRVGLVGPPGRGHHPASRRQMRLELWHDDIPGLPSGADNIVVRAGRMLGEAGGVFGPDEEGGRDGPRTVLDLSKSIPIAGGMGGGSADAAAALVGLNELWGCELSRDALRELAAELGSDVPFLVAGGTALATGRGTAVAQVLCRGEFHWVVWPDYEPLSTAPVFEAWDRHCVPSEVEPDAVLQALLTADAVALGAALHNDLEPAAFELRPRLADRKRRLLEAGALGTILAGSGPTLLGLAEDSAHAEELAAEVQGRAARSPAGGPEFLTR